MIEAVLDMVTPEAAIVQGIGFVGMILMFVTFQQNTNRRILFFQSLGALVFLVHYFMLPDAKTAAALNMIAIVRNAVFFCRPRKWADNIAWLYIFCFALFIAGFVTYTSPVSLIATAGIIFGTVAFFMIRPKMTRRFSLCCSACYVMYNIFNLSVPGIVCEIFVITSIGIAMFKYDFIRRAEDNI